MTKYIVMLVLCAVVGAAMAIILKRFLRRLDGIERERWGDKQ